MVYFQLGGGRLCQCGVIPAEKGSSVPVWCDSSWEGVVCASVVFLRVVYVFLWVICACVCFQLGGGSSVLMWCDSIWEGVICASVVCFQLGGGLLCSCGVLPALRGSSVPM